MVVTFKCFNSENGKNKCTKKNTKNETYNTDFFARKKGEKNN